MAERRTLAVTQRPRMTKARYAAYLRSTHWHQLRREWYRRYGSACQALGCSGKADHLHHATYERLGNERFADLLALCERHHTQVHERAGDLDPERLREATVAICGDLSQSKNTLAKVKARKLRDRAIRQNPCPTCGAAQYRRCVRPDGRPLKTSKGKDAAHKARKR